jgi:hypothetical protein
MLKYRQHVQRPLPEVDYPMLWILGTITLYNYIKSFFRKTAERILIPVYNIFCLHNTPNNRLLIQ